MPFTSLVMFVVQDSFSAAVFQYIMSYFSITPLGGYGADHANVIDVLFAVGVISADGDGGSISKNIEFVYNYYIILS